MADGNLVIPDEQTPTLKREEVRYDPPTNTVVKSLPGDPPAQASVIFDTPRGGYFDPNSLGGNYSGDLFGSGSTPQVEAIAAAGGGNVADMFDRARAHVIKILDANMMMPYDWILDILNSDGHSIIPGGLGEIFARECQADPLGIEVEDVNIGGIINSITSRLTKSDLTVTVRDSKNLALYKTLEKLLYSFGSQGVFNIGVYCTVVLTTIETNTEFAKWDMIMTKVGPLPLDYSNTGTHLEYPVAFTQRISG